MAWLVRDGEVLASLDVADTARARIRGLIGLDRFDGAYYLPNVKSVHTFGMRFPLDVAFVDDEMRVIRVMTLKRRRVTPIVRGAAGAIEAEAGLFAKWGLRCGDELEIR